MENVLDTRKLYYILVVVIGFQHPVSRLQRSDQSDSYSSFIVSSCKSRSTVCQGFNLPKYSYTMLWLYICRYFVFLDTKLIFSPHLMSDFFLINLIVIYLLIINPALTAITTQRSNFYTEYKTWNILIHHWISIHCEKLKINEKDIKA